ncbi:tetratricopeptide repeat protein [Aureivirga sp. CE67]|uniref:tetratricopeptide repeat protein n=1 Tax=Aureivirga sp. CE67 TaxID=1788983 RepID=UPI0018CBA9A3|nr:tetratricopeptide repeat protein [Aureivirga sp. CE67]
MKKLLKFIFLLSSVFSFAQENCLIYPEGSAERKSCELSQEAMNYKQGSKKSQELLDKAIDLNPKNDYALKEKSVPFLKRGFLKEGLGYLDKAVEANPIDNLDYRAFWFFCWDNYELCIRDLERYYSLPNAFPFIFTSGGDMDMRLLLAMSYAKTGKQKQGLEVMENYFKNIEESDLGNLDYYVLGIMYFENNLFEKAIESFEKQLGIFSGKYGVYYYLAYAYKVKGELEKARKVLEQALNKFQKREIYSLNTYNCYKVYYEDLVEEYEKLQPKMKF